MKVMGKVSFLKSAWNRTVGVLSAGFSFCSKILIEPHFEDEDVRRREHVLNIILVGSIALLLFLDGIVAYHAIQRGGTSHVAISFAAFSLFLAFFVFLYILSRRGFVGTAPYLLVGAYFVSNSYAAYRWGAATPTVLVGYALLIIIAGVVVNSRFGFITAGIVAVYVIPIWWAQSKGVIYVDPSEQTVGDGLALAALYILIMTVAWLSNREIENSLARARRSESALAKQRDRLEIEVEERTRELRETQFIKTEQLYRFAEFGQLASGLFHDLVNFFNAVLLRMQQPEAISEVGVDQAKARLEDAGVLTERVKDFVEATRKQLADDHSDENFQMIKEIRQTVNLLAYTARKKGVRIIVEGNETYYFGNCFKFHQIILNLVLNGIESYDGLSEINGIQKEVRIRIQKESGKIIVTISDHGPGIAPEIQEKIFKPFFTTKNGGKGMGLGLAIVKKIIENDFHGNIKLRSELGKGSEFVIEVPIV